MLESNAWAVARDIVTCITAVTAIFLSVLSIFLSHRVLKSTHEHNRKSVMPLGDLYAGRFSDHLCLSLVNQGTGPMRMTSFKILVDGKQEEQSFGFLQTAGDIPAGAQTFSWTSPGNTALPANNEVDIFRVSLAEDAENVDWRDVRDYFETALSRCHIIATFTDIYEEYEGKIDFDLMESIYGPDDRYEDVHSSNFGKPRPLKKLLRRHRSSNVITNTIAGGAKSRVTATYTRKKKR